MDDIIVVKTCVPCKTEKLFEMFYRKHSECKTCNTQRVSKRYYSNKDDILQKCRDKHARC